MVAALPKWTKTLISEAIRSTGVSGDLEEGTIGGGARPVNDGLGNVN